MASDDFTNSNGVALTTHNSDWAYYKSGTHEAEIQANACQPATTWDDCYHRHTVSTEDFSEIILKGHASPETTRAVQIRTTTTTEGYRGRFSVLTGTDFTTMTLHENGTWLAQATGTWDATVDITQKITGTIDASDLILKVYADDVEEISYTDTSPMSAGNPGFETKSTSTSDRTVYAVDNWADGAAGDVALIIQDAAHAHSADNLALTQANVLATQDAAHAHTADNLDLVQANVLVIQDGAHAHLSDNLDLTQQNQLAIADALHAHTADNVTLDVSALLVIQDAAHSHTADNLTLTQANVLAIQDALHALSSDNVDLVQQNTLVISDALHALISDNVTLTIPSDAVTPRQRTYIIQYDDRTYVVMAENRTMIIH